MFEHDIATCMMFMAKPKTNHAYIIIEVGDEIRYLVASKFGIWWSTFVSKWFVAILTLSQLDESDLPTCQDLLLRPSKVGE
jgi:hypothetical protein